jgi:hypothetical protein
MQLGLEPFQTFGELSSCLVDLLGQMIGSSCLRLTLLLLSA